MKAVMYLTKELVSFTELGVKDIRIEGVLKLSVGQRLIYVEYLEDDKIRIRAFGKNEFNFLGIDRGDNSDGHILDLSDVTRLDMRFPRPMDKTTEPIE